jgi:putative ABC transport system substrate-binding protein
MTRVSSVVMLIIALLAAPLAAEAQPAGKVYRIGTLNLGSPSRSPLAEAFWQGLRELGYVEGRNVIVEARWAEGRPERLPGLAADLVRLKVDVIVADGIVALAAKQATTTIPIVMPLSNDPVRAGLVESLARPGGNVTGQAFLSEDLGGKWMELLKEAVPRVSRVAVLWHPGTPSAVPGLKALEEPARQLRLQLQPVGARTAGELEGAFSTMARDRAQALLVGAALAVFLHARVLSRSQRRRTPQDRWKAKQHPARSSAYRCGIRPPGSTPRRHSPSAASRRAPSAPRIHGRLRKGGSRD